jgi:FtsP/CotA-like multicopper oxidase with cupredoxin domain
MFSVVCIAGLLQIVNAKLFTGWNEYTSELKIPKVIDMRNGGTLNMVIGEGRHSWSGGYTNKPARIYGYAKQGDEPTYPGPTILASADVPIKVNWVNNISGKHILDKYVEKSLVLGKSACYPKCGVPAIVHIHGLETPAISDGLPTYTFSYNKTKTDYYSNNQLSSTMVYHDHAMGLTRLNVWAGMIGTYIIQDIKKEKELNMNVECDIPIMIQDKLIEQDGSISYAESPCNLQHTKWAPESYGSVNLVNGVVMTFVNVPQQQCRLRLINGANARAYKINIPFYNKCYLVAKDSGFVKTPIKLKDKYVSMYPFERVELICDFSDVKMGTKFNIKDDVVESGYNNNIIQFRVTKKKTQISKPIPSVLNDYKDLKALWKSTNGKTRNITLNEVVDADDCPIELTISENNKVSSFMKNDIIQCEKGKVERWNFKNPTADFHPFHWHVVHFQCGPDEKNVNTNELKDVFPIPNSEGNPDDITQVCFVACTPGKFLVEKSVTTATDFGFSTKDPYLIHCHILEHEENEMMTWFSIAG